MSDIFISLADSLVDLLGEAAYITPEILMMIAALLAPLLFFISKKGTVPALFSLIMMALSGVFTACMMHAVDYGTAFGMFRFDGFSSLMMLLFLMVGALFVFISPAHCETTRHQGEYYALISGVVASMMFVVSADNLLAIFVGVEVVSIFSYALTAMKKNDPRASEAAVKYLIFGALSSALTLYGMSMIYGVTGTIDLYGPNGIVAQLQTVQTSWAFVIGVVGMLAGYGFKISAVPFHSWAPDVYEGASTPVSGILATGSKKMGFAVMFKIFLVMFVALQTHVISEDFQMVFAIIAAITMTVGNVVAISQSNIKRMLAYSSIAQAGYILISLAIMTSYATVGGLFHMFTHVFMKGGAFVVVAALITAGVGEKIEDYNGLAKRSPFTAAVMLLFLFSLAGIPPLAGFASKFVLFGSTIWDPATGTVSLQWLWLTLVAVLNSAISLYYYARVVKAMYIEKPKCEDKLVIGKPFIIAMAVCALGVIILGLYPNVLLDLCEVAAGELGKLAGLGVTF